MLSKLVSRQVLNHGLRLVTRASSAAAQQKVVGDRKPDVKYRKVSSELYKKKHKYYNNLKFFAFFF